MNLSPKSTNAAKMIARADWLSDRFEVLNFRSL
jgi:hypothetical protein